MKEAAVEAAKEASEEARAAGEGLGAAGMAEAEMERAEAGKVGLEESWAEEG